MSRGPLLRACLVTAAALLGSARGAAEQALPPVRVTLAPARPYLVLGSDGALDVAVEVSGPGAEALLPTRVFATVGTLEPPRPLQPSVPGRFQARYQPPAERFPQVALLVVELGGAGAGQLVRGVARLPLHGTTEMPLRSSPGASVTLRVVDRTFGPVTADRQGHVKIAIEVPPGVRTGVARAVDYTGNLRETEVDLQPAPFRRVLIVAPSALEVGSFAEVAVVAVDPTGEPIPAPRLSLRSSDGLVHPLGSGGPGEARFLVEAPRRVGAGALALTAVAAGTPLARADLAVPLNAGRPHALALAPSTRRLVVGSGTDLRVVISAHDQFGNPTSADGAVALVDGRPAPIQASAGGQGLLTLRAPPQWSGTEHLTVEVALGDARAQQEIRLTGGPPAGLTLVVRDPRLIADGTRGTELRVRAVDRNGTPTMIPGLSWETPGGRIKHVRMPREGEYVAEFVPDRAQDSHREAVAVMASQALRADASLEVAPPPSRVIGTARVGLYSNLGHAAGPAVFVEGLTPLRVRGVRFAAGLAAGYLRDDVTTTGSGQGSDLAARLVVDQLPLLAVARYRLTAVPRPEVSFEAGAGLSFAHTRITTTPPSSPAVEASLRAVALQLGAEAAFPLRPGRLVVGVRYLWIALGRTSQGDEVKGNSAGLLGDLGYRLIW